MNKIAKESKLNKGPTVLLFSKNIVKGIFSNVPDCKFFNFDPSYSDSKGSLMKARITSGDTNFAHLVAENFLSRNLNVIIQKNKIKFYKFGRNLPSYFSQLITNPSKEDLIEVTTDNYERIEIIEIPFYSRCTVVVQIDVNEILSINFEGQEYSFFENISFKENASNQILHYAVPKICIPFNPEINAIGIDLGTSRCCAAVIRQNGIHTVPLDNTGERLLPSYVAYDEEKVKCGIVVVDRLRNFSKSTVFDSKRIIGRCMDNIEIDSLWPFELIETNGKVYLEISKFGGRGNISAEEVAADLLKQVKQKSEAFQGTKLGNVVITVPAAFTESQKSATFEAAKLAGWETIHLLPEPIAAAFAYFNDRPIPNNSNVLLFDLGGGTLDVCVFKIVNNQIQIISNTGDSKFGGRDFDTVLINHFKNALSTKYGISVENNRKFVLMSKCQKIKETLSSMESCSLDIDDFDTTQEGIISINRKEFESMTQILINKVRNTILAALFESNYTPDKIDKVLLVGGGSRMPMIKELLQQIFPKANHICEQNPDEVVAVGAAYYAYSNFTK